MYIPKYFHNLSEAEQSEWIKAKKDKVKANLEKRNAQRAKWRAENREKRKAYNAKWRAENLEKTNDYQAKYRAKNREKRKAYDAKWYAETRSQKSAIKFLQMTQAISEIANINTEKK